MSKMFVCTPHPASIFCGIYQMSDYAEPYVRAGLKRSLERLSAVTYAGSVVQWKDYLALGEDWVPRALREAAIDLGGGNGGTEISLRPRGRTIRFKGGFGEKTMLSLDLLWEPADPSRMEIRSVTWNEHHKGKLLASSQAVYFKPVASSSDAYKDYWSNMRKDEGRFSGKSRSDGGLEYVAHIPDLPREEEPGDSVWGAQCSVGSEIDPTVGRKFMAECLSAQGFRVPGGGRAPASVGDRKE